MTTSIVGKKTKVQLVDNHVSPGTCGPAAQNRGTGEGGSVHMVPDGDLVRAEDWTASSGLLLHRSPLSPLPLEPTPAPPPLPH